MHKIKPRILIIDDDRDILDTLQTLLETEGYEVVTCESGREAREQIEKALFSAILLDIYLPDFDGLDFIQQVQMQGVQTPVVVITGSSEIEMARKAIKIGVFDYLVKPIKNRQLLQIVRNAVTHNFLREERENLEKQKRMYQEQLEKMVAQKTLELEESEYKYKSLVEQSLIGVFVIQDGNFHYMNAKACEILNLEPVQVLNKKGLLDFIRKNEREALRQKLQDCIDGKTHNLQLKLNAVLDDGTEKVLQLWIARIQYQKQPALEGIVIDISEQVELQKHEQMLKLQLMSAHKMAAIGNLAAGIAHNLNNPISVIQANAELLHYKNPEAKETERILEQTQRMIELINTIVMKGHREQRQLRESIDLNQLIRREMEFLNANLFFKHKIEKVMQLKDGLPKIHGQYSDFSQSLNNIIDNAIHAMYQSSVKRLTISTDFDDQNIILKISDTGQGIEPQHLPHIFDPFFTTKQPPTEVAKKSDQPVGSGLGLSMVKMLLEPYGVRFDVQSKVGQGTTFSLLIPYKS